MSERHSTHYPPPDFKQRSPVPSDTPDGLLGKRISRRKFLEVIPPAVGGALLLPGFYYLDRASNAEEGIKNKISTLTKPNSPTVPDNFEEIYELSLREGAGIDKDSNRGTALTISGITVIGLSYINWKRNLRNNFNNPSSPQEEHSQDQTS